jgi:membrane protease YdiL (CAAX protease family)
MDRQWLPAAGGIAAAIAITTLMDAAGYSMFSALPLFPLAGLFWYLQKFSRADIGLVLGPGHYYGLAIAYPVIVLGVIASIAFVSGAVDTASSDWNKAMLNMALMSTTGVIMVLITEEGFFRGWLWAALRRAGLSDSGTLVWTSIAFTAWHISAVSLETGFDLPAREIPVYLINATLAAARLRVGRRRRRLPLGMERHRLPVVRLWRKRRCARYREYAHLRARSRLARHRLQPRICHCPVALDRPKVTLLIRVALMR